MDGRGSTGLQDSDDTGLACLPLRPWASSAAGARRVQGHGAATGSCRAEPLKDCYRDRDASPDSKLGSAAACRPSFSDYPLRLAATSAHVPSWADSARRGDSDLDPERPPSRASGENLAVNRDDLSGDAPFRRGIGGYVRHDRIVRHLPAWPTTYLARNKHDDQDLSRSAPLHRCVAASLHVCGGCRNRACRDTQHLTEPKGQSERTMPDSQTPALFFFK